MTKTKTNHATKDGDDNWFLSSFHKGQYVSIEKLKRRQRSPPDHPTVKFSVRTFLFSV